MARWESNGLADTIARLQRLADPDATPLMEEFERIIAEDNEQKVMASQDWQGQPLKPVTYRPVVPRRAGTATRLGAGLAPRANAPFNNLTWQQYRTMAGPPTAPRGMHSRVVTNLLTMHGRDPGALHRWFAMGAWADVVDVRGKPFLDRLFATRDLRGVRPEGLVRAQAAIDNWASTLF